jgi:hypothetical protein
MPLVRLPLGDGHPPDAVAEFEVDYEDIDESGTELLAKGSLEPPAPETLAASLDRTLPALSLVLSKVKAASAGCDEIAVELGLRIGGETGLVFVKGSADATIGVTVTWRRPPDPPSREAGDAT